MVRAVATEATEAFMMEWKIEQKLNISWYERESGRVGLKRVMNDRREKTRVGGRKGVRNVGMKGL
jgi:hypothetical protein